MSHFPQEIITVVGRCAAPLPARSAVGALGGGLPGWLPADRAIPESTGGGACLLGCPPPLTLVCFFAPYPPSPLPRRGRGRLKVVFMQGAPPLASPGLNPSGTGKEGRTIRPAGGLPFLSPANPDFSLLFCPHPPDPLPLRGRGSPRLFHARGSAPCIPGAEPTGCRKTDRTAFLLAVPAAKERGDRGRWNYPSQATAAFEMVLSPGAERTSAAGGLPFLSPVCPAFSLLFCPHPPSPLPLRGRGSPRLFHARGSAPCIPGG